MIFKRNKKKKESEKVTRILFATDIHGQERVFRKFINAAKIYGIDVLILGGDITGKLVVPIIEKPNGTYETTFMDRRYILKKEEIKSFMDIVSFTGNYPYITSREELEEIKTDPSREKDILYKLMIDRLNKWISLAEERLKNTSIVLYITGGNDDPPEITEFLKSIKSKHIIDPEDKIVWISSDNEMISCGYGNITPWRCPRDISEEELYERIERMADKLERVENAIFNIHVPPHESGLDICPKLDTSIYPPRPIIGEYISAGSIAVRKAIENYQPLIGLHGHIHESRGKTKIGRTLCFNPGSEYSEGILRGVILDVCGDKVRTYSFISG